MEPRHTRGSRAATAIYRALLALYPSAFRQRFGDRMVDDFARSYDARVRSAGWSGAVRAWGRILVDTAAAAAREHRERRRSGRSGARGRRAGGGEVMGKVMWDLRLALRAMRRRPGYSAVAVATLALAVGANTALFSVLHGVLLRPLPYPDADRLALLSESAGSLNNTSYPNFLDWRERARSFDEMGAFSWTTTTITGGDEPVRLTVGRADPSFMSAAGMEPALGRGFLERENAAGAPPVAILSHGLWQQSFGGDPGVLGRAIGLNGAPAEIVGVLAPGADFAEAGTALWIPLVPSIGAWTERREVHALSVLARLAPSASMESALGEMQALGEALAAEYAESNAGRGATLRPLRDVLLGDVSTAVWLLTGMAGLVLLIACANLANLLLVRLASRRDELAMRRAVGASRWDVARLLLTESLTLSLLGGALGVGAAFSTIDPALRLLHGRLPRVADVSVDGTVLLFALGLSVLTGVLLGLLPGIMESRMVSGGARDGRGRGRSTALLQATLSTAQVAGAVILLVGSGLLMRSMQSLQSIDVGFDPEGLATLAVSLSGSGRGVEEVVRFYRELPAALEALPGVEAASAVNALPISGGDSNGDVTIDGRPFAPGESPTASFRRITPGYFATLGTPILHGRDFEPTDTGEPMVTIVNESMARLLWTDPADAVGARIKVGPADYEPWLTVVGVAGDIRNVGLETEPRLATYEPHAQRPWSTMTVVYRADGDPTLAADLIRQHIHQAGGEIPVYDATTLSARIAESLRPRRTVLLLTGAFAALTLLIASIGVYGVLGYNVQQRSPELGLRLALGAGRGQVVRTVVAQAVRMISVGLVIGLAGAALLSGLLDSALYGVRRYDVATFALVPLLLATVGVLASWVPARRASRIDPASSLRQE